MNPILYEPQNLMGKIQDDVNDLFHSWKLGRRMLPLAGEPDTIVSSDWVPLLDIKETDQQFLINVDVPGVEIKDIDVCMNHGMLSIQGERKAEKKEDNKGYHRVERSYGAFHRRFTLPETADSNKISAKIKDGVLSVAIDKKEAEGAQKITVQSA